MAPVAARLEVTEIKAILQAELDAREAARDLASNEGLAADRRLVVEEDAVTGKHAVRLAVVDGDPVGVKLGDAVRRARIEGRRLALRRLPDHAVQLGARRLVEAGLLPQSKDTN